MVLHCEAVGSPVPEIQWWFEGNGPNDTCAQLWDGARLDRVHIHAAYRQHAASSLSVDGLAAEDMGTYECRASSDPDRNHLTRPPRVKWVRAQASVVVLEREWPGSCLCLPLVPPNPGSHSVEPDATLPCLPLTEAHLGMRVGWTLVRPTLFQAVPWLASQALGLPAPTSRPVLLRAPALLAHGLPCVCLVGAGSAAQAFALTVSCKPENSSQTLQSLLGVKFPVLSGSQMSVKGT